MRDSPTAPADTRMIPLEDLRAHPLNSNVMPEALLEKLTRNIKRTGRYPHLIVRPHPKEAGVYEVLDGHHRIRVLKDLGHTEARCDVWAVDDREAKVLLATLNRLEGQDQPLRRAQLLHDLLGETGTSDLAALVPESEAEIRDLHALLEFPADDVTADLAARAAEEDKTLPQVLTFVVRAEHAPEILQAIESASDGIQGRDRKARGLLNLARHYLEPRDEREDPTPDA